MIGQTQEMHWLNLCISSTALIGIITAIDFILCTYQQGLFSKNPVSSLLELSYVSSVTAADLPGLQYSSLTPVKVFNYL